MKPENIEGFPLSPQQKRLWQLQQQDGQTYAAQSAIQIKGKLDRETLKQALQRIIERHEILRTNFHYLPGMTLPVQVISQNNAEPELTCLVLSGFNYAEQEARMTECLRQARLSPFDLSHGPLLRLSLVELSPDLHVLHITLPSLCADTRTLQNFLEELSSAYAACLRGENPTESSLQYADYAAWQYELLAGDDAAQGMLYWSQQQSGADALRLSLSDEDQTPEANQVEPQSLCLSMTTEQVTKIEAMARRYQTSVEIFLLTCWQVLLWHLTGQSEITVGYMSAGRKYSELHDAMGLFARALPLRSHFQSDFKFNEILTQMEKLKREAEEWEEYFLWGQDARRDAGAVADSFPVAAFEFEERPATCAGGGLVFAATRQSVRTERFEIRLTGGRAGDSLSAEFHFDPTVYRRSRIERLAEQFECVLQSVIEKPEIRLDEVEVIGRTDQQLLTKWNDTRTDYSDCQSVPQLFEAQVEQQPDSVAVLFDEQQVSYRELNERANKLAHFLRKRGVGPATVVGVCLPRSVDMVVAILGVLKAGGTYVPLDFEYPRSRLAYMLTDTHAGFLLSHEGLLESLPEYKGEVFCLDRDSRLIDEEPANNPSAQSAESVAYIVYTSGSTGQPKGVMTSHRAVVNYLSFLARAYGIGRHSVVLQLASLSFDASVRDLLGPIMLGGTTVILKPAEAKEPAAMLARIRKHNINVIAAIVPTLLRSLMEAARAEHLPYDSLRTVLASGETLYISDYHKAQEVFGPEVQLVNQYGPTECTMTSSYEQVGVEQDHRTTALIGKPITNASFYILNEALHPVAIGVRGQICIGGAGLAYGYLNRPDLTAASFLPDPFGSEPGMRMYKTGDFGRYLSSGKMELSGRMDRQIKLRGQRIELGEIEAALAAHPAVREAVVTVREDSPGGDRLVAYVVGYPMVHPSSQELRSHLRESLPEYMIPSAFVMLTALPLTPNGKVDRRALPSPEHANREWESTFVAPRTPAEEEVAAVWARVLGHERVGIHDNFFELGGHSLLAIQLVSQLSETFDIELPLISLFEAPTVAELSLRVTQMQLDKVDDEELMQMIGELAGSSANLNEQPA